MLCILGAKVEGNAMEPTASLLTAVLVAGAATMTGMAQRNGQPLSLYDVNQGFGRVDLSRSLPLSGVTDENWRLQVLDSPVPAVLTPYAVGPCASIYGKHVAFASLHHKCAWQELGQCGACASLCTATVSSICMARVQQSGKHVSCFAGLARRVF